MAGLIVVHDARAMSNVGTHKLMALVSNTQMNVEHNTELSALAVAFYKSQSQTLTICSTTSLATECQTRCLGKPMRVRPLLPNGINNQSLPWFTGNAFRGSVSPAGWLFFFDVIVHAIVFSPCGKRHFAGPKFSQSSQFLSSRTKTCKSVSELCQLTKRSSSRQTGIPTPHSVRRLLAHHCFLRKVNRMLSRLKISTA